MNPVNCAIAFVCGVSAAMAVVWAAGLEGATGTIVAFLISWAVTTAALMLLEGRR